VRRGVEVLWYWVVYRLCMVAGAECRGGDAGGAWYTNAGLRWCRGYAVCRGGAEVQFLLRWCRGWCAEVLQLHRW